MIGASDPLKPELFFGLVGPIGVDLESVQTSLEAELKKVGYGVIPVRATDVMTSVNLPIKITENSYYEKYRALIEYADDVCKVVGSKAALAALCVAEIKRRRLEITGNEGTPADGYAFIIRQFKRPAEIELMRKTYGRKFVQVSVSAPEQIRRDALILKLKEHNEMTRDHSECEKDAIELIKIDHDEAEFDHGQKVSKVFHLGDVFVDAQNKESTELTIRRFVEAFFGHNGKSPSHDEYGMYLAAAASLRSIDLSRQVGASIFSDSGEILALGCNEVPKPLGGTYWGEDTPKVHRDFDEGKDANHKKKLELLSDLIQRMGKAGFLSEKVLAKKAVVEQLRYIMGNDAIKDSKVMDIIEFGRMIHAEMSAITDAARIGRSIKEGTMYCTTFPCHMCAKHIVSAGIRRLVYLEPYPKSYAKDLHPDSITYDNNLIGKKVVFESFIGISPRRYRDIFEKKLRKDGSGKAREWYYAKPQPMIEDMTSSYLEENEEIAISILNKLDGFHSPVN